MSGIPKRQFVVTFHMPTGDPDGLRIVEKPNWLGQGVVFNRTNYKQVVNRSEFNRPGVYILVATVEGDIQPTIYIGEADPIKERLDRHHADMDFWEWAVFFVAKDESGRSLNKAHVQHLEAELLRLARDAKQSKMKNRQEPSLPTLSNTDSVFVENFLDDILSIVPLLGVGVFKKTEATATPVDVFYIEGKGVKARGYEDQTGFLVLNESQLVKDEVPSLQQSISAFRKDLLEQGVIVPHGTQYVFAQNHIFKSPSAAASTILGRPADGRKEWKTLDGRTLREVQEAAMVRVSMPNGRF